jgi:parallel beta-helix repeat protein
VNNICFYNEFGIGLEDSTLNYIGNNICNFNNGTGIHIGCSKLNTIENNHCSSNNGTSIDLINSVSTTVSNNKMFSGGLYVGDFNLEFWNTHTIDTSNTVNGKPVYYWKNRTEGIIPADAGQIILANCTNVCIKDQSITNCRLPIKIGFSSYNNISHNTIINNSMGIFSYSSKFNIFNNNTFISNYWYGIFLRSSSSNTLQSNTFKSSNYHGIAIHDSKSNIIINNNISTNKVHGIFMHYSNSHIILNNNIFANNRTGIKINNSNKNIVYHNNFINNKVQSIEKGDSRNNFWDNGFGEGNYWSDYSGVDNGSNGRIVGDGIGDTNIPHLGLDNYPFVNSSGWLFPGIPILIYPGELSPDGNYSISWFANRGTTRFILEEDNSYRFDSPTVVYQGLGQVFEVKYKPNGTYYYRLKACSENYESCWSNIVDIIVDWLPDTPQNLIVSVFPGGNILNLSWDPNPVDTKKYEIYYKNKTTTTWELLATIAHPECIFDHSGLNDGEKHDYRLKALDARGQLSKFSKIVSGIPADSLPPSPPIGLLIKEISFNYIKLVWEHNIEEDIVGYNIYRGNLSNMSDWGDLIGMTYLGNQTYIDHGLDEHTTYYYVITAFDEVPNESDYSIVVSATTLLGPHGPEINNSLGEIYIEEDCYDNLSLNLYHLFKDLNNDPLTFWCKGQKNIDLIIWQENGTVVIKPKQNWYGEERLTFYASDNESRCSYKIKVIITPINDPPGPVEIVYPTNGTIIEYGMPLNFKAECDDPDIPYGDELTFIWTSNINGDLGIGKTLRGIVISVGEHEISITVVDNSGNSTSTNLTVIVLKDESSSGFDESNIYLISGTISGVIILIILVLLIFILLSKKREEKMGISKSKTHKSAGSRFSFLSIRVSDTTESDVKIKGPNKKGQQKQEPASKPTQQRMTVDKSKDHKPSTQEQPKKKLIKNKVRIKSSSSVIKKRRIKR